MSDTPIKKTKVGPVSGPTPNIHATPVVSPTNQPDGRIGGHPPIPGSTDGSTSGWRGVKDV